jgi:hypothetical protein
VIEGDNFPGGRRMSMILVLFAVLACSPSGPERAEDFLIRLADLKVTSKDFLQAFELVKTAYPGSLDPNSPELQNARHQLLQEMSLELILLKRSEELKITVSPAELDAAVDAVKADYPTGVFEQTLVESTVSFETWKQRLRLRLLLDKLVEAELRPQVAITAGDVEAYYDRNYRGKASGADSDQKLERLKEILVADLRRGKMEEAFDSWIEELKQKYPVEVNVPQWERIALHGLAVPPSQFEAGETQK